MFGLKEVVPTGPPEYFQPRPSGRIHIPPGFWLLDKTIHLGPNSSITNSTFTWADKPTDHLIEIHQDEKDWPAGFYLTPGKYTLWGRFLRTRLMLWLRWSRRGFITAFNKEASNGK